MCALIYQRAQRLSRFAVQVSGQMPIPARMKKHPRLSNGAASNWPVHAVKFIIID